MITRIREDNIKTSVLLIKEDFINYGFIPKHTGILRGRSITWQNSWLQTVER